MGTNSSFLKPLTNWLFFFSSFALFFCDCTSSVTDNYDPGLSPPAGIFSKTTWNYYTISDTILLMGQKCDCVKDSSIPTATITKYNFKLSGIHLQIRTPLGDSLSGESKAYSMLYFERLWGNSFEGGWTIKSDSLIIPGELASADSQKFQALEDSQHLALRSCWLNIQGNQFTLNSLPDTGKFTAAFIAQYNDTFSKYYNVTFQPISADSLDLVFSYPGSADAEIVAIARNIMGLIITSTAPGTIGNLMGDNAPTMYKSLNLHDSNPYIFRGGCPSRQYPDWLQKGLLLKYKKPVY